MFINHEENNRSQQCELLKTHEGVPRENETGADNLDQPPKSMSQFRTFLTAHLFPFLTPNPSETMFSREERKGSKERGEGEDLIVTQCEVFILIQARI